MRILVTGSRHWSSFSVIDRTLTDLRPSEIAHGACRTGADAMADGWALRHQVPLRRFRARWRRADGTLDRNAGPARNQRMLEMFEPDLVVAFKDGLDWRIMSDPAGRGFGGTEHMVWLAAGAGIRIRVVDGTGAWVEMNNREAKFTT